MNSPKFFIVFVLFILGITSVVMAQGNAQPKLSKSFTKFIEEYQNENGTELLATDDYSVETVVKAVEFAFGKAKIDYLWTDVQAYKTVVYGEIPASFSAGGSKVKVTVMKNETDKTWMGFYYRTDAMGFATAHAKMSKSLVVFGEQVDAYLSKQSKN